MAKVLTAVAALFFLGGLALTVGYLANLAVQWQMTRTVDLQYIQLFYLGAASASIGMVTLALLEIRLAILMTIDSSETPPDAKQPGQPGTRSRVSRSWKKGDIQRSFLDTRES